MPIYLMDASTFIHRAFHAIRNLTNREGRPTGAIYGFTATLLKLLREKEPEALAVIFDSRGQGRRHKIYPDYKANRPPMDPVLVEQQEGLRQVVEYLGIYSLEKPGFEADDLIATMARKFADQDHEVVIVSGDKDFYQLLNHNISMYDPDPKKNSALTPSAFKEKYGLPPSSFLDMQALMGDTTDNIPGVPGIGEKKAQKLIATFGSLDEVYAHLKEVTPDKLRESLDTHRESAYLSRELASLGQGVELDFNLSKADLKLGKRDEDKLFALFKKLEFTRMWQDLNPTSLWAESDDTKKTGSSTISYEQYVLVTDSQAWDKLMSSLSAAKTLAVDLETDSIHPSRCNLVGMSLCAEPGLAFYIPIGHHTLGAQNQDWELVAQRLEPHLSNPEIALIGQNAKFDWLILARYGMQLPPPSDDPMLASYLLDPESHHGLDFLSIRFLGHQPITFKEMVPDPKKNFGDLSPEEALDYAAEDADLTLRLAAIFREKLKEQPSLLPLYQEVELPLENLLAQMEGHGVLIDAPHLNLLSQELAIRLKEQEHKIFDLAGRAFNIGSPKQMGEILFKELGLPPVKKTAKKTGYSTDDGVLAELALLHPLPGEIRQWRSLDKLKSTYVDKLPREINPKTGRVHTSYNQTQTATGRLSSSDPNLQNIPARSEEGLHIREAFIAPPGFSVVAADYSQVELRILAHFSKDKALLNAFALDEDIHTQTATEIFGVPASEVTSQLRQEAKTINFGVVYGQGAFALGRQLGIPQTQAKNFITRYFARFPGVKRYMEETREQAHSTGQVNTWFGRVRLLRNLSGGYQARQEAERMAINTPIQGTAADIIKMAMLAVDKRLALEYPQARMVMQVHDELVLEVPDSQISEISEMLKLEMAKVASAPPLTGAEPLTAVLKVDVGYGKNWAEAH